MVNDQVEYMACIRWKYGDCMVEILFVYLEKSSHKRN